MKDILPELGTIPVEREARCPYQYIGESPLNSREIGSTLAPHVIIPAVNTQCPPHCAIRVLKESWDSLQELTCPRTKRANQDQIPCVGESEDPDRHSRL